MRTEHAKENSKELQSRRVVDRSSIEQDSLAAECSTEGAMGEHLDPPEEELIQRRTREQEISNEKGPAKSMFQAERDSSSEEREAANQTAREGEMDARENDLVISEPQEEDILNEGETSIPRSRSRKEPSICEEERSSQRNGDYSSSTEREITLISKVYPAIDPNERKKAKSLTEENSNARSENSPHQNVGDEEGSIERVRDLSFETRNREDFSARDMNELLQANESGRKGGKEITGTKRGGSRFTVSFLCLPHTDFCRF